ncbi:regulator [Pseudofrankia sp. BMG5.36]|nr:regulator [Pseudofrankia sp. BMG5.36]
MAGVWRRRSRVRPSTGLGDATPLPRRVRRPVPPAKGPVTFVDDPALLERVAERLRVLDLRRLAGLRRLN